LSEKENEGQEEEKPINLLDQIQKHIKDDTWFFVDEYSCANSYVATYVSFYHQNQKIQHISNYEIKKDILKKMGI
jgi:glutathione S-transferase